MKKLNGRNSKYKSLTSQKSSLFFIPKPSQWQQRDCFEFKSWGRWKKDVKSFWVKNKNKKWLGLEAVRHILDARLIFKSSGVTSERRKRKDPRCLTLLTIALFLMWGESPVFKTRCKAECYLYCSSFFQLENRQEKWEQKIFTARFLYVKNGRKSQLSGRCFELRSHLERDISVYVSVGGIIKTCDKNSRLHGNQHWYVDTYLEMLYGNIWERNMSRVCICERFCKMESSND